MRTLAVGDIHGCLTSLRTLAKFAGLHYADRLILLGDYVDRGPDSKGVIDWILDTRMSMEVIALAGNHEDMMIAAKSSRTQRTIWESVGGQETLFSYEAKLAENWVTCVPAAHWDFLNRTDLYFETENHIFIHGAAEADRPMNEQDPRVLKWVKCYQMRPHSSGKTIVCGHSSHADGDIGEYAFGFCIDTNACRGGWLTCLEPESGKYWQANEYGETRKGAITKH